MYTTKKTKLRIIGHLRGEVARNTFLPGISMQHIEIPDFIKINHMDK